MTILSFLSTRRLLWLGRFLALYGGRLTIGACTAIANERWRRERLEELTREAREWWA